MSDSSRKSHGIGAAVDKLFRGIEILIAIFLGAMIFFTFMNVILRQFGIGFPWSEEIARICFIYLIYLGAIIAARENQHLMIDTLICKLPPLGQKVLYVIIQGLIIWLMWILTNGAFLNGAYELFYNLEAYVCFQESHLDFLQGSFYICLCQSSFAS